VIYAYNRIQLDAEFLNFFNLQLYMFRTDVLYIVRSLDTVFTAIAICHTSYQNKVEAVHPVGFYYTKF